MFAPTQREALTRLRRFNADRDAGLTVDGRRQPLARYVARWLEQRDPRTPAAGVRKLRYTTWTGYDARMRRHVLPRLGATAIGDINPERIRAMLADVAAQKVRGHALSSTTVAMVRDTLATILERAVRDRMLPYNPVDAVDAIARAKPRAYAVTADEARAILRTARGDEHELAFVLGLYAGLRESEVFGLRWDDVDLEGGELTIRRALVRVKGRGLETFEPKTLASAATVPLAPPAIAALRAHATRQKSLRLRAGAAWHDEGYVVTTELGTPVSASNFLRRHFYPVVERAGLPTRHGTGVRFHDLRHGCGSLLVSLGVAPKLVQRILRHARISTTLDLYVHAYDADLRGAVNTLAAALGS